MRKTTIVAALFACLILLAGCGSGTTTIIFDGSTNIYSSWREGMAWDPFAPSLEIQAVPTALENAVWRKAGKWQVTTLDTANAVDKRVLDQLQFDVAGNELAVVSGCSLSYTGIYVKYDAAIEHVAGVDCSKSDRLALAAELEAGVYNIGVAALDGELPAGTELAAVRFAEGPASPVRRASFSQADSNAVRDLEAVDNGDETATLGWSERNTGDYDLNSEVGSADLVPIAQHFLERVNEGDADWAVREVVDGDENTEISSADLVPIAQNLGSTIQGYNIFRTALATQDEVPDPAETGRWAKLENAANPSGPSIPRDLPAGQNFRLRYTFKDECGAGDFGWYVSAVGPGNTTQTDGPASEVETLTVGSTEPPEAALSLEFVPPAGSFMSLNDEFYVAVRVDNITDLSSVNVRLEYDATLLEFVEGVGEYDTNTNLLSNYLFLAVDEVGTAESPYQLMGFNITQKQGTAPVTGSGVVGYLRFKAIGSGISTEAIRFPQATTYLLLWGEQYGVPVAVPGIGGPLTVNIG